SNFGEAFAELGYQIGALQSNSSRIAAHVRAAVHAGRPSRAVSLLEIGEEQGADFRVLGNRLETRAAFLAVQAQLLTKRFLLIRHASPPGRGRDPIGCGSPKGAA